jgi:hypothetical protein
VFSYPSASISTRRALRRREGLAALLALALSGLSLGVLSPSARAAQACKELSLSQPFLKWGDAHYYELATGGDFEKGLTGWSLSGGAKVVTASESYGASGTVGKYSLALPAGATAQSPYVCVEANYPTFRFFARNEGSSSNVAVEVLYKNTLLSGGVPSGSAGTSASWAPTAAMQTGAVIGGLLSGGTSAQMALRFRAVGAAARIDDVFIDPRMR